MSSPIDRVLALLPSARRKGHEWMALCPAHDDHNPSLSVGEGRDGRVILHCFTRCDHKAIVRALGLTESDLFLRRNGTFGGEKPTQLRLEATYPYVDENSVTLFQSLRFEPKTFRLQQPDGRGGWNWHMRGVRRVLYNLPRVIEAVALEQPIVIVEGEKCADALNSIGITATTNVGGAGKWLPEYNEILRNARVSVLADNDDPGRSHAGEVVEELHGVAASLKLLALPGLP